MTPLRRFILETNGPHFLKSLKTMKAPCFYILTFENDTIPFQSQSGVTQNGYFTDTYAS